MAQVFPLSEGVFTIGHDKIFHPFDLEKDILNERPIGSLLVEVQPFLVITSSDILLLDAGLGFNSSNGQLQIHDNLAKLGYSPKDVTKVLLTHLHKDHAGGISFKNNRGEVQLSFPNAQYFIHSNEVKAAMDIGYPSYIPEELVPVIDSDNIVLLNGEEGFIGDDIFFQHSGGHSKEHIVFLIDDGIDKIFFGGDEAPQLKQMKIKYVAKYDFDGKKAMELRAIYAEKGKSENWQFLFYHDVQHPIAIL